MIINELDMRLTETNHQIIQPEITKYREKLIIYNFDF